MTASKHARLVSGLTLLIVPTILYGGWTLLGLLMHGSIGAHLGAMRLDETQWALWRAGHAHAGVWTILSLIVQLLLDSAHLSAAWIWLARISAPLSAIVFSAALFGLAFSLSFSALLYLGILLMLVALLTTGVGLLRGVRAAVS